MPRKISLTIDNGPTPGVTEDVLEILDRHDVKATFFVVGENIDNPAGQDLIAQVHAQGHRLGNHTYSHSVLFGSEPDQQKVLAEIDRTQALLGPLGQERLFRPFGGGGNLDRAVMSRTACDHLSAHGYTMVLWNSIPNDWLDPQGWPDTALAHMARHDWTVTVVHDLPTGAMQALGSFIVRARESGAEFRSDYPEDLMPLVAGKRKRAIDAIMSDR